MKSVLLYAWLLLIIMLFLTCQEKKEDLLSPEERQWIDSLGGELIHAPDPLSPPIEFFDNDSVFKGITADYLKIISERLDIKIKTIKVKNWAEVIEKAKKREIDFSTAVQRTVPREEYWNFTTPYYSAPNVIIIGNQYEGKLQIEDFAGKKVAIVKDYAATEFVKDKYPDINFETVPNVSEAIKLVSFYDVDAAIIHLSTAAYYTEFHGFTHLKVAGDIDYPYNFTYASRNDWPILNQILQKGLNSITPQEKKEIYDRWISLRIVPFWKTSSFWYSVLFVTLLFSLLLWFVFFLRRKNNELKIATAQAKSANQAKSLFLANMSHEIRTPMNAILGFTDILTERSEDKKQKEFLNIISKSGESLLSLINDILDLSKIEAGKLVVKNEWVSLKNILAEIKAFFYIKNRFKNLDFIIEFKNNDLEFVYLDSLRIKQVLLNIVGNAVKFTTKGFIKIVVNSESANTDDSTTNLNIEIEDTGIGIPQDQQQYIFEAFSQAKNNDNALHGGTGLGLAISKKLMEMMNGQIECSSIEGKGSIFTLTFRNAKTMDKAPDEFSKTQPENAPIHFNKASILIVDDSDTSRKLMEEYLSGFDFNIMVASNSTEGIDMISSKLPDLIITDIKMPYADDFKILNKIQQLQADRKITVIAVSANVVNEFENTVLETGFDGFLKKPIKKVELVHELKKHLSYHT